MTKLAAIVLTKNEEQHIGACLDSLAWADRCVVIDSFSTDRTCDIAREHGAEVIQHPFSDYAAQRNVAIDAVDADWIFFVDADERATPELAEEIRGIVGVEASAGLPKSIRLKPRLLKVGLEKSSAGMCRAGIISLANSRAARATGPIIRCV